MKVNDDFFSIFLYIYIFLNLVNRLLIVCLFSSCLVFLYDYLIIVVY